MGNILLLGHDGQVGWELQRALEGGGLGRVRGFSFPEVDFGRVGDLRRLVREVRPSLIVNAAAYTAVDKAESEPDVAHAVNATAPAILAEEAQRLNAVFVHYSTDFVFDGRKGTPYTEEDPPAPLSVYGETKLQGELAVGAAGGRSFVFRLSWVYGARGSNFLLKILKLAKGGTALRVVDDQVGSPTWCRSVAEATVAVLRKERVRGGRGADRYGLYHMTCSGRTTWYGFAKAFLPESSSISAVSTDEFGTAAARPAFSVLDCSRLKRAFGLSLPPWQDALGMCLQKLRSD